MKYGGLEQEFNRRVKLAGLGKYLLYPGLVGLGAAGGLYGGKMLSDSERQAKEMSAALMGAGTGLGTAYLMSSSPESYSSDGPTQEYTYEEFDDIFA